MHYGKISLTLSPFSEGLIRWGFFFIAQDLGRLGWVGFRLESVCKNPHAKWNYSLFPLSSVLFFRMLSVSRCTCCTCMALFVCLFLINAQCNVWNTDFNRSGRYSLLGLFVGQRC